MIHGPGEIALGQVLPDSAEQKGLELSTPFLVCQTTANRSIQRPSVMSKADCERRSRDQAYLAAVLRAVLCLTVCQLLVFTTAIVCAQSGA